MAQKIQEQLGQVWQKLLPLLQRFTVSLLATTIPTLEHWSGQLLPAGEVEEPVQTDRQPVLKQVQKQLVKILSLSLQKLIPLLKQWQEMLVANAPSGADAVAPLLPENVQQEIGTAWQFVQTQLIPVVLQFLQRVVNVLDPPLTRFYQFVQEKSSTVPFLVKVAESPIRARVVTSLAPAGRFITEKMPESLQPIVAKRAAAYTLVAVVVLFFLFKPLRGHPVAQATSVRGEQQVTTWTPDRSPKAVIPPDRILVADIQAQVAKVAQTFGEGLIQSVQANFQIGKLVVLVTDEWYQLGPNQQDQMMDNLLQRSMNMGFKKLLLADTKRTLIARNPDVGVQMVVLQRQSK